MNKIKFFGLIGLLMLITSCSTHKVTSNLEKPEVAKSELVIKSILAQKPQFVHLSIQSKINADIDGNRVGLNGKIYIRDGKKIWINVSKFGINAARALITPEGFKAYEKLDKTYIDGDFTYFNHLLKVDFIDYSRMQNLLLGRIFVDLKPKDFQLEIENGNYVLNYLDNEKLEQKPKAGKYIQTYTFDPDFRLIQALLKDPTSKMELTVDYQNWTKVGVQYFPKNVKVLVKDNKTQKVDLEYNNFTFEESSTPFEIPSGYEPRKLPN